MWLIARETQGFIYCRKDGPSGAFIRRPEEHASQANGTMATMRLKADCMKNPKEKEKEDRVCECV